MPGPMAQALIAHLDSVFVGPNGDYPATLEALDGVSAAQALWKPAPASPASRGQARGQAPGGNSIWQIVDHLTASKQWQIDMLEKGQASSPPWTRPEGDETAWRATVARLQDAHIRLKIALGRVADADLLKPQPAEQNRTLLELILSASSAHEAHHSGQIDYLKGLQSG
ncbi:MAG TPA: DinB family protein [Anaerolineales bacterium]